MILKHRRGTTQEWQEVNLDLIPEAGELVIEECSDGTRKCKIGTGYTRFSDLPYIDDKTKSELLAEISNVKKCLKNQVADIKEDFIIELGTLEAELKIVETKCYELESDYTSRDANIRAILEKNLEDAIKLLETKISDISQSTIDNSADLQDELTRVENRLVSTRDQLKSDLEKHTSEFTVQLNEQENDFIKRDTALKNELTTNIARSVNEVTAAYISKHNELKSQIDDLNIDLDSHNERINATNKRISDIIALNLKEGDLTKAEAELADLRNRCDAASETSNALSEELASLKKSLDSYIDTDAVDGLYYDSEGTVGYGEKHYLYLTADGQVVKDTGIYVPGGGGGNGVGSGSSLKINRITPQILKVSDSKQAIIRFTFEGQDSSGDPIQTASATWRVNDEVVARGTVTSGTINTFDASEHVTKPNETIHVRLTVTDGNISSEPKKWEIELIDLKITSDFNDKEAKSVGESLNFTFTHRGDAEKTAYFILDGDENALEPLRGLPAVENETYAYYTIPADKLTYGSHLLEVYLEAELESVTNLDGTITTPTLQSDSIFKDIICFDDLDITARPVIGTSTQNISVDQYESTPIIYTVYDPATAEPEVDIRVKNKAGEIISERHEKIVANSDYDHKPVATYIFTQAVPGEYAVEISCGDTSRQTSKLIKVTVIDLGIDIRSETAGLVFDFNPATKTRNDKGWSYGIGAKTIDMETSDDFDWTNGGFIPEDPDGPCFCIKAGSTATINYNLFEKDAKDSGMEFKLVFKTKNVTNPNAQFLKCVDFEDNSSRVGVEMCAQKANIYGKIKNLELVYSENDLIEFEFNISKYNNKDDALNMVMGYEDGVPSRPMIYDGTYTFKHDTENAQPITLGSPDCDLYIYRFKVYDTELDELTILKNFIADARTSTLLSKRFNQNKLFLSGKFSPETLAEACPHLRIITIETPYFTGSKKDNVPTKKIRQIYKAGRNEDNWTAYGAIHSGQGTSSDNYGAAGRNIDLKVRIVKDDNGNKINESDPYFELANYEEANAVSLTDKSVPVDYFTIKVNIASSNNLTNALLARRYNKFNPYRRPFVREEGYPVDNIKDTMEFYNCVVFVKESSPTLSDHREFNDTDWHFYAIGNIGDSKKTDKTRLTDLDDPYECCVEIMDVGLPLSAFPKDTMMPGHYIDDEGNIQITWSKDENREILYDVNYSVATGELDLTKTYYRRSYDYVRLTAEEFSDYKEDSITEIFERIYEPTSDTEVVENKKYYTSEKILVTAEQLKQIIDPSALELFEWTGEYAKVEDRPLVAGQGYFIKIDTMANAMETITETEDQHIYATQENIDDALLYFCEFKPTTDTETKMKNYYQVEVNPNNGEDQCAAFVDLDLNNNPTELGLYELINATPIESLDKIKEAIDQNTTFYILVTSINDQGDTVASYYMNATGTVPVTVKKYRYATQDNLDNGALFEVSYHKTEDETIKSPREKTYCVDILENDDFSENYTYGWRYISDEENEDIVKVCKRAWIEFYRFVTTSTDEEFKERLQDFMVEQSALYYYLFTTRYCMVDNRAKNTFWHFSKTGIYREVCQPHVDLLPIYYEKVDEKYLITSDKELDPGKTYYCQHAFDLNWAYDNDTSLGLNNYGKQVYRYGLEDSDTDENGEEVFRQSDSLFYCRIRDLFSYKLKELYQTLETKNAWDAENFIKEADEWQEEFPEGLWLEDIKRKYIRTYTKSFINKGGDKQFLQNMANGRMKYQRRQWERNQEQYMASKYQTTRALGDSSAANFRVGRPAGKLAIAPNYEFSLTPHSYIYLNVQYGGADPISVRATELNKPIRVPYAGTSADIIDVGSAAAISSFGDLSKMYPRTVSLQNATSITELNLGNSTIGYQNNLLANDGLTFTDNDVLESLDLTNIVSLDGSQDYSRLVNLTDLKAQGTNIKSFIFAEGGKLTTAALPDTINNLTLRRLTNIVIDKDDSTKDTLTITNNNYTNVETLFIEGCPNIDQFTLFERCNKLKKVRLDNIDFGVIDYDYFDTKLFHLKGLTVDNKDTDDAQISGKVHFTSLNGEQFNEVIKRYPNLVITYDTLTSVIKFVDTDRTTILTPEDKQVYTRDPEHKIDCTNENIIPETVTEKTASAEFRYELFGWSTSPDEPAVNYENLENALAEEAEKADRKKYNEDMLTGIEGDRVFYPVFKEIRREYRVQFIGESDEVLKELGIPYGSTVPEAEYVSLLEPDTDSYDRDGLYCFTGWIPAPEETKITGNTMFIAQFIEDELTLVDVNYILGDGTISITGCKNKFNDAVKIPDRYELNGKEYEVTSIGGFENYTKLGLIKLPNTLTQFEQHAFNNCTSLKEIEIPSGVKQIAQWAFANCSNLTKVELKGNVTTLGPTCFYECNNLTDINLKEGLEIISTYVFRKTALKDVVIPSTVAQIGDHAFSDISTLKTIEIRSTRLLNRNNFHYAAFAGSGDEENPLQIYVPWTEEDHYSTFGGTDSKGTYYQVEVGTELLTHKPIYGDGKFGAAHAQVFCTDTPNKGGTN